MMRVILTALTFLAIGTQVLPAQAGRGKIQIQMSKRDIDLKNRTLHFRINTSADSATIRIFTPEGTLIAEKNEMYSGARARSRLSITWPDLLANRDNFRLELTVTDTKQRWVGKEIIRFYLEIPHEEVVFVTGNWDIRPHEEPKLDAALAILVENIRKYGKLMQCKLYIIGHTDTVGSIGANRELSRRRAKSIAAYFYKNGVKGIPIYVRGFGEEKLAVDTGDDVAEERNRRAQYILSSSTPDMIGPGSWQRAF